MKNKWKKLNSERVYDNSWISVEHHDVITPSNTQGIYGKVLFKNLAIGVVPLDKHQNTWLVGQYRYTIDQYSWEIPMGGGDLFTDPLVSAQRELREETGLTASNWNHIMTLHTSNCVTDEIGHVYLAQDLKQGDPEFDETEDLEIKKLHFYEAYAMVMDGSITDAISVAALLKTKVLMDTTTP